MSDRLLPIYGGNGTVRSSLLASALNAVVLTMLSFGGTSGVLLALRVF